jgi:hypothetical protein
MEKVINDFIPGLIPAGKVKVYHSPGGKFPKLHIDPKCDSISQIPEKVLRSKNFTSTKNLSLTKKGRPCRKCTLERMLATLLAEPKSESTAFITFSSQSKPDNPDSNLLTYNWQHSTISGVARLEKLVANSNLQMIKTSSGMVAFGNVNYIAAKAISNNLRSVMKKGKTILSKDEVLCTWVLLNDNPPELAKFLQEEYLDVLATAKNLLK